MESNTGKKIILVNWKSNKTLSEAMEWMHIVGPTVVSKNLMQIILCPPFSHIAPLHDFIQSSGYKIDLGTQDISPFPSGSYTGAVNTRNLEGMGVHYALLGHSERRNYFHESSNEVANKVALAVEAEITPIVCVSRETIIEQAAALEQEHRRTAIVLYETPQYIGSGETEPMDRVLDSVAQMKKSFSPTTRIIYGGSVGMNTPISLFLQQPELSGVGIASAALDPHHFVSMMQSIE